MSIYQFARFLSVVASPVRTSHKRKVSAARKQEQVIQAERRRKIASLKQEARSLEKQIEGVRDDFRLCILAEALSQEKRR